MNLIDKRRFQNISMWSMGSYWFGIPQMFVYSYLIDGLLIDTGHPNISTNFLSEIKKEKVDQCIITHHHEDHSGNASLLKKELAIDLYASPKCVEILKSPPRVSPIQYVTWGQNRKVQVLPLDFKSNFDTENYSFQILETPGHAVDMIALYEPNEGWLFSADNFVNRYINVFMDNEVMLDQIHSLEKLLSLDFDVLLCSHFPQFRNGKSHIQSKLNFLEDFYDQVRKEHEKGKDAKEIMKSIGLKEKSNAHIVSLGKLSQLNMVLSALKTL